MLVDDLYAFRRHASYHHNYFQTFLELGQLPPFDRADEKTQQLVQFGSYFVQKANSRRIAVEVLSGIRSFSIVAVGKPSGRLT